MGERNRIADAGFGTVIFTGNRERLVGFYQAVAGLSVREGHDSITVLESDGFELVIHDLAGEPPSHFSKPRNDAYVKPFFQVKSLAETRQLVAALGGQARSAAEEWGRGRFRACEAVDPDGNPIQFRQLAP